VAAVIALIHGKSGAYGISFPDFAGCISGGETIEEAIRRGREALAFHVEGMEAVGEALPKLRDVAEIRADPELAEDLDDAVFGVVDLDLPGHPVRINISIDERLLERADRAADASGETRSGYLAAALKERLAESAGVRMPIFTMKKKVTRAKKIGGSKKVISRKVSARKKSAIGRKKTTARRRAG
jgi:predicted RNase H-like HicB family nuclease